MAGTDCGRHGFGRQTWPNRSISDQPRMGLLFYGWQLIGEGLSLGEVRDTTFTLSGITAWVGKQVQLNSKPISLGEGWELIT